ncbi:hypothetical protein RDABS01_025050 [Bienertia sinuspersici]
MKFIMYMLYMIILHFIMLITSAYSKSNISVGYTFTLAIPSDYSEGFNGKAYLMETDEMPLNFKTAMSIEAIDGRYACSLEVYLGNVKVWSSGHVTKFFTSESCMLEFSRSGDLMLKGYNYEIGWKTGTSRQGVEKLKLLDTGNLVLVDDKENIKWQTFNFPTNILLLGQRLSVATHLTSFPTNNTNNYTTSFFSFEIHHDKVALYLNSVTNNNNNNNSNIIKNKKYSYWEFHPSKIEKNITFIELASRGLEFFDDTFKNFSQIIPPYKQPIRFLALDKETGNIGFYYYSPYKDKFEPSFQVLNTTCDLPLACPSYGICTLSKTCSCIRFLTKDDQDVSSNNGDDCNEGINTSTLCEVGTMLELEDASSLLKNDNATTSMTNVSKGNCANSCLNDCECNAALYSLHTRECMFFEVVRGVKQVKRGSGLSYLVKVPRGELGKHKKSGLKNWVLVLILVADGIVLFLVVGGVWYFMIWKRKKRLSDGNCSS